MTPSETYEERRAQADVVDKILALLVPLRPERRLNVIVFVRFWCDAMETWEAAAEKRSRAARKGWETRRAKP